MAIVTLDGGQSSSAVAGLTPTYITGLALQELSGCPDTVVAARLQRVLVKFYTFTTGWREVIGPYAVTQGVDTVGLNPVDQNKMVQFVLASWLFPSVTGGNERQFLNPSTRKVIGTDKDLPSTFFMQKPDELVLYPTPDKDYGSVLFCYASLIPTPNAAQLPNITFTHHLDTILAGLLADLMGMQNKPWTNVKQADEYRKAYARGVLQWRAHAIRNYGPRDVPTIFPPFAGRGSQLSAKAVLG